MAKSETDDANFAPPLWKQPDGKPVSCLEKIKVLNQNLEEIRGLAQDALEDAVLMGCDEAQIRAVFNTMVESLKKSLPKAEMSRIRNPIAAVLLTLPAGLVLVASPAAAIPMDTVLLQGLDKITARVSTIKVPVGQTVTFGALQITARACDKHPPEETPEAAAFLEVVEVKPDEKPVPRFSGWMFASSPALSALEHPVYDLIVLDCLNSDAGAEETPTPDETPAAPDDKTKPADKPAEKPADQGEAPAEPAPQ